VLVTDEHERALPHDPDLEVDEGPEGDPRPAHLTPHLIALAFAGGFVGVLMRAFLDVRLPDGGGFARTTFLINISGAFLLAVLIESLALRGSDVGHRQRLRLFLGTGVLGGYTTYSALAVHTVALVRDHQPALALAYAVATVALGFVASVLGIVATRRWVAR
jgi:CrcB protein